MILRTFLSGSHALKVNLFLSGRLQSLNNTSGDKFADLVSVHLQEPLPVRANNGLHDVRLPAPAASGLHLQCEAVRSDWSYRVLCRETVGAASSTRPGRTTRVWVSSPGASRAVRVVNPPSWPGSPSSWTGSTRRYQTRRCVPESLSPPPAPLSPPPA